MGEHNQAQGPTCVQGHRSAAELTAVSIHADTHQNTVERSSCDTARGETAGQQGADAKADSPSLLMFRH